ncbi:MAG: DNA translocase FtsK [Planctomycetota bacterium]
MPRAFDEIATRYIAFLAALLAVFLGTSLACHEMGMRGIPSMRDFFIIRGVGSLENAVGFIPGLVAMFLLLVAATAALVTNASFKSFAIRAFESIVAGFLLSVMLGTIRDNEGGTIGYFLGSRLAATMSTPIAVSLCAVTSLLALWLVFEGNLRDLASVEISKKAPRPAPAPAFEIQREIQHSIQQTTQQKEEPADSKNVAFDLSVAKAVEANPPVHEKITIAPQVSEFQPVDLADLNDPLVRVRPRKSVVPVEGSPRRRVPEPAREPYPVSDPDSDSHQIHNSAEGTEPKLDVDASNGVLNIVGDAPPSFAQPTIHQELTAAGVPESSQSQTLELELVNYVPTVGFINNETKQDEIYESVDADRGPLFDEFGRIRTLEQHVEPPVEMVGPAEAGEGPAGLSALSATVIEYDNYSRSEAKPAKEAGHEEANGDSRRTLSLSRLKGPQYQETELIDWDLPRTIPDAPAPKAKTPQLELFDTGFDTTESGIAATVIAPAVEELSVDKTAVNVSEAAPAETKKRGRRKQQNKESEAAPHVTENISESVPAVVSDSVAASAIVSDLPDVKIEAPVEIVAVAVPAAAIVPPSEQPAAQTSTGQATSEQSPDLFLDRAARVVISQGRASISFLQRKLSISLGDAQHIMAALEAAGVVGPYRGTPSRDILIDLAEWDARRL